MTTTDRPASDVQGALERIRRSHFPSQDSEGSRYCAWCDDDWPCDAITLAAEVERLQHHIAVQHKVFYDFARDLQDNGQYELARTVLTLLLVENVDLDDTTREE
jgi:hypothetical protein